MNAEPDDAVMSTEDRLIHMVNQIARNCEAGGPDAATTMVAEHLRLFWDPAMRERIIRLAGQRPSDLSAVASRAVARLAAAP